MTHQEKIDALYNAGCSAPNGVLQALESAGFTVYKKKVSRGGRRPNTSQPMTPKLKAALKAAHIAQPHLTQAELAAQFKVNPGRVSEALA